MSVVRSEIEFVKSATVTDTSANGGKKSYTAIPNRTRFNLFPRVTRAERLNGLTRYRKEFIWNKNNSLETAFGVMAYLLFPSPAGDRFYLAKGTQTDTQTDINSSYSFVGGGKLNTAITAGATSMAVLFESNDIAIVNGATIVINSHFSVSQTMATDVKSFDAVKWDSGTSKWIKFTAPTADEEDVYPYGTFLGSGIVFNNNSSGRQEYLTTINSAYTNEVVGAGNGTTTQFNHTASHIPVKASTLIVKYTIASSNYQATDNGTGTITGTSISSGTIDYETGEVAITFSTAPDNSTNVTMDYTERCYSWSGNVATIKTVETFASDYITANSYVGTCLNIGDIKTSYSDVNKSSPSGTFDDTKIVLDNQGTVEDTWTFTLTSATAYTCSGATAGSVGTGATTSSFSPANSNTAKPYFTIPTTAWGGTWAINDTVIFKTHPAAAAIWWKEVIPSGTAAYSENGAMLELYVE